MRAGTRRLPTMPTPLRRLRIAALPFVLASCALAVTSSGTAWANGADVEVGVDNEVKINDETCTLSCRNSITVTRPDTSTIEVNDTHGLEDAGSGCTKTNGTTIRCTTGSSVVFAKLGAGDDSIVLRGVSGF